MVFSRLFFIYIFLPLCLLAYAAAKGIKNKNTVLIIFSLIFYAWGEPVYVLLMVFSAFVNYIAGLCIKKYRGGKGDTIAAAGAVIFDFLMLGIFKYSGFIVENVNALFSSSIPVPDIKLPIGISFYTFQTVSYVIDCHWEKVEPQKSFKKYLLYLSLFPQLVAGPIVRYSTIEKEIDERSIKITDVSYGLNRIALGLGKKVILANQLSIVVDNSLGNIADATVVGAWYGAVAYAMQIYFDFFLAALAHLTKYILPRLPSLCADIRQKKKIRRTFPCMALHRYLARCKLELHFLGTLLRCLRVPRNADR